MTIKLVLCQYCGNLYQLGYNGIKEGCDECLAIEREPETNLYWEHDESYQVRVPYGASIDQGYTVQRPTNLVRRWDK